MSITAGSIVSGKLKCFRHRSVSRLQTQQLPRPCSAAAKADMFRGDCHIDGHMIFPIRRTFPRLAVVAADENVERCGSEPFACIAFLYFCPPCLLPDYDEIPGLEVDCRWSHTSGFQDICQFLVFTGEDAYLRIEQRFCASSNRFIILFRFYICFD